MPFVFVHGVNTRSGNDYEREQQLRNAFLKEIVAPKVRICPSSRVWSPYWGKYAIKFWKNLEVIPTGGQLETLGVSEETPPSLGIAIANTRSKGKFDETVKSIMQQDPKLAIDLLWDVAITKAKSKEDFEELARAYRVAQQKLAGDTSNQWLRSTNTDDFADTVFQEVRLPSAETLGGRTGLSTLLERANEQLKRLILTVPDLLSSGAVAIGRKSLTRRIATFMGDAFQYLAERGDGTRPGPIASEVIKDLQDANEQAKKTNEPLIVISHSFGGEIVYDILTHYATDINVDTWVTVGSQVGLFEEMSLMLASPRRQNPAGAINNEAISSPKCARRWINIVDSNDVLGFLILPVFNSAGPSLVQDFTYDTGYPVMGAHSGYFEWPSFYKRLAHRLSSEGRE